MKTLILAGALALLLSTTADARGGRSSGGSHFKSGHFRSNGTYVRPSYATNPNRTQFDNYSARGNVNPYTGLVGTRTPRY